MRDSRLSTAYRNIGIGLWVGIAEIICIMEKYEQLRIADFETSPVVNTYGGSSNDQAGFLASFRHRDTLSLLVPSVIQFCQEIIYEDIL